MNDAQPSRNGAPPGPPANDVDVTESGMSLVLITIGILCATLMQTLDTTIINVALPIIQGNLGATIDEGAWVVTGYIISAVVVIPITPWLQLRFGRKQYYSTAIIGFTIASVLCGTSGSIGELIFWRIVQGAFGGGLIATAQATLRDTFPKSKLGLSQGLFSIGAILGPAIGPALGGWLTDNYSWNWVFFINVVPGALAAFIMITRLRNPMHPRRIPLDAIGLALLILGLGSLQYVLGEGQRRDWFGDDRITFLTTTALLGIVGFIVWELIGTKRPIVDIRVLRYRSVSAGSVLAFAIGATLYGAIVIFPQYVQSVLGFTATDSGLLIFSRAIFIAVGTPFVVRFAVSGKIETRYLLLTGFFLIGVSQLWFAHITTSNTPFWTMVPPNMMSGFGLSLLFVPISLAILGGVPPQAVPKAASFQSLSQQLGGSISTAALVTLLARRQAFHQDILASNVTPASIPFAQFMQQHGQIGMLYGVVLNEASAISYADAQLAIGILAFVLIPVVFIMPQKKKDAPAVAPTFE